YRLRDFCRAHPTSIGLVEPPVAECVIKGYTDHMTARAKQLLDEVLELPAEERDAFAAKLLERLDVAPDARTDEEWADEIGRRTTEALDPAWRGRTWEDVRADVELSLRASRGR